MIYDVIVLGGGPAGCTAALYCARAGRKTAVIEQMMPGGQMCQTAKIDNYPGFPDGIDGISLGTAMQQQAERFGAEMLFSSVTAVKLTASPKQILTGSGTFSARAVILATGAEHRHLGVTGETEFLGRGVGYCAACDGMLYRGKRVCVIGGGDSAVGDALYLSELCEHVTVIHRRSKFRASSVLSEALAAKKNVDIWWEATVNRILGDKRVQAVSVQTPRGERMLQTDGVFISIGRDPVSALFSEQVCLDENGYILAGESTETSIPGVFAAGDLRTKAVRQVVTAVADGAAAAYAADRYLTEQMQAER